MRYVLIVTLLLCTHFTHAQHGHGFLQATTNLPEEITEFIPRGLVALDTTFGNLNKDTIPDLILVACSPDEKKIDTIDFLRAIILLVGQENGQYKLAGRNNNIIYCVHCGGLSGDPFMGITIKNGYFSVEHFIGFRDSREASTITFKYSEEKETWFLNKIIKETTILDWSSNDVNDNIETGFVKDVRTAEDFGIIPFEEYCYREFDIN